jgi:hypothetical protein
MIFKYHSYYHLHTIKVPIGIGIGATDVLSLDFNPGNGGDCSDDEVKLLEH